MSQSEQIPTSTYPNCVFFFFPSKFPIWVKATSSMQLPKLLSHSSNQVISILHCMKFHLFHLFLLPQPRLWSPQFISSIPWLFATTAARVTFLKNISFYLQDKMQGLYDLFIAFHDRFIFHGSFPTLSSKGSKDYYYQSNSSSWLLGFPGGSDVKESACNMGDQGAIPGLERPSGGRHGNPLQYSCLENPHGQRSLAGYGSWDRTLRHYWASSLLVRKWKLKELK